MDTILNYVQKARGQNPLIIAHDDADADALGAAFALSIALNGRMAVPQEISDHGEEIIKGLAMEIIYNPQVDQEKYVIVVDTADKQQLPGIELGSFALIDHHRNNTLIDMAVASYHVLTDSTCQLVYDLLKELDIPLNRRMALALAAGILGDTIFLEKAAAQTITCLGQILQEGQTEYKEVLELMRQSRKLTRETKLKAALQANLYMMDEHLLIFTQTERNYVYYVAMMFLELGADIALVSYEEQGDINIRLVKHPRLQEKHLNLMEIMKKGIGESRVENLWGDEQFVGFKGRGDHLNIINTILQEFCETV